MSCAPLSIWRRCIAGFKVVRWWIHLTVLTSVCFGGAAYADQIGVIIDTSTSMVDNDSDQMAVLGALMLADLLDPDDDEFFVLPFDKSIVTVDGKASAKVFRRGDHPPNQTGTDSYVTELMGGVSYDGKKTLFAPALRQALGELSEKKGGRKLIILLTDGVSGDPRGEVAQFNALAQDIREDGVSVWVIGLGKEPSNGLDVARYFAARRLGGYIEARDASRLLPAFAEVMSKVMHREFEVHKVSRGKTLNVQLGHSLARTDVVYVPVKSGLPDPNAFSVEDASGRPWMASTAELDIMGEVNAVHKDGTRGELRSYRRVRLETPTPGVWSLKSNAAADVLMVHHHAYDLQLSMRRGGNQVPQQAVVRNPVSETLCFDLQIVTRANTRVPAVAVKDPNRLRSLEVTLKVSDQETGKSVSSAPRSLDDDGNAPHDPTAGDGVFGKCWSMTPADVGRTFQLDMQLNDRTLGQRRADVRALVEAIPAMILEPGPSPLVFNGGNPMETGQKDCQTFSMSPRSSYFREDSASQKWLPEARLLVELGHQDGGKWVSGLPKGESVSKIAVTLDGASVGQISAMGKSSRGWTSVFAMDSPRHEVCVFLGTRRRGGRSSKPIALRLNSSDPTYSSFAAPALVVLDINTLQPGFWEVYSSLVYLTLLALVLVLIWLLARRPARFPDGLMLSWEKGQKYGGDESLRGLSHHKIQETTLSFSATRSGLRCRSRSKSFKRRNDRGEWELISGSESGFEPIVGVLYRCDGIEFKLYYK